MTVQVPARELADQLLGACGDIESELGRRLGSGWRPARNVRDGLRTRTIELKERKDAQVTRYYDQILAFGALRNAIAHDRYRDGRPIAVPFPETVQAALDLAKELLEPTSIRRYVRTPVTVQVSDLLAGPLSIMVDKKFSQLPAFHGSEYQGLLTTNAVARWVGAHLSESIMLLDVPVSDVLAHTEDHERAEFVSRRLSALEAIDRLTSPDAAPVALLVTENGKGTEGLLGVLTVADVPQMHRDTRVPMP